MEDGQSLRTIFDARFCRGCGYDLRASIDRCPECGRGFDANDRRSFYRHARTLSVQRWARRCLVVLLIMVMPPGLSLLWLWWGWRAEQSHIAGIMDPQWAAFDRNYREEKAGSILLMDERVDRAMLAQSVACKPQYPWLSKRLPLRLRFLTDRVTYVGLMKPYNRLSDADLNHLGVFSHLIDLQVWSRTDATATDAGLRNLRRLTGLKRLELDGPWLTDATLANLEGITELRHLVLAGPAISDLGMVHLGGVTHLEKLYLGTEAVTDNGLRHLAGMKQMKRLTLSGPGITDGGLRLSIDDAAANSESLRHKGQRYRPGEHGLA